jgi:class 3 adenylate cyclase/predicted ATPase
VSKSHSLKSHFMAPAQTDPADAPASRKGDSAVLLEAWLHEAGLGDHAAAFRAQRIAPQQVSALTDAELRELGLPLGDRIRFRQALARIEPAPMVAERRPLTVAFFDLVDSTGLAERVEPEDLIYTLRRYHDACIGPILRYGGQVARFLGDGILAYFCYPVAHEDDPERAVRAALEAVAAVSRLTAPDAVPLAARAGIATGRVVTGALFDGPATAVSGEPNQALGTTPNLAARLQTLAPPGGVVIASETADRLRGRFALEDLGQHSLRGFAVPVLAFRALAERPQSARPHRGASRIAGFVGRQAELAFLNTRWSAAIAGRGGAVVVRGEAGIGKSRLARRFITTRAARGASATFTVSGSPFYGDDPLQPVAVALRGLARSGRADAQDALDRLRRLLLLDHTGAEDNMRLAALADLLGLAGEREAAMLAGITPARLRALTLDSLATAVARVAGMRPLLLVVEDAHWLDPTTLELLERVVAEVTVKRLLIVLTAREEFSLPGGEAWAGTVTLELKGLQKAEATRLFAALCGNPAPPQLGHDLATRTGGVPLFVEEFARALAEKGACEAASAAMPAIPVTLHECLAARLDRAGPAKAVAQAGAVLGQDEVRAPVLAAVAGLPEVAVEEALVQLEAAGVLKRGHGPRSQTWRFRHALLREAAYDSLLRDCRRALHSRAADALANGMEPAIVAHHLSEAGRALESVAHFLAAARRSLARSALQEAMRLLRRGLMAIEALPESLERNERRIQLMSLLGPVLIGLLGPASPEAQTLYADAVALARSLPPRAEYFPIFWGWWRLSHVRDFHERRARAASLYSEARSRGDRGLLLQAHHCNWASLFHQGDLCGCDRHAQQGLAIYREDEHGEHASLYGNHDAKVCGHAHRTLAFWQRGRSHAAEVEEARALAWARRLGHAGSVLHALEFATSHRAYRRDPEAVRATTERMCALAEEHGFGEYRARCRVFHGWAMAVSGEAEAGAALAAEGLAMEREMNTADDLALFHCLVAEAWDKEGEAGRALAELAAARDEFERIGLRYWLPEVWRTIGDLTLRDDPKAEAAAAAAYAEAGRIAEEQGAHRLALRAALSAARLALRCGGDRATVVARLAAARARVSEIEAGAADLRDADALANVFGVAPRARPLLGATDAVR